MNLFIHSHYYLPDTRAGAEIFLHEIAKYFLHHGHRVMATVDQDIEYNYEGVEITTNTRKLGDYYQWADRVITHLMHADYAIDLGHYYHKAVFHLLHNNDPASRLRD